MVIPWLLGLVLHRPAYSKSNFPKIILSEFFESFLILDWAFYIRPKLYIYKDFLFKVSPFKVMDPLNVIRDLPEVINVIPSHMG